MKIYKEKVLWDVYYYYNFKNIMEVPFIYKVSINSCFGSSFLNKDDIKLLFFNFSYIFSQKPIFVKSKKSISEFKIKRGENISLKVTLRRKNMYNFLYKFLVISLPLIKNFNGLNLNSFDKFGNYHFGISNYSIFPEFNYFSSNLSKFFGFNISIIFKNSNINKSLNLLKFLNFPFKDV